MPADPAREIADLCQCVLVPSKESGEAVLARHFGLEPSSAQFLVTLGAINHRIERLCATCEESDLEPDDKMTVTQHLLLIQQAFLPMSLRSPWRDMGSGGIRREGLMALKLLSAHIRTGYRRPEQVPERTGAAIDTLRALQADLGKLHLGREDFLRHTLHDAVEQTCNRLGRLFWLGWENALRPLREIIAAQFALERIAEIDRDNAALHSAAKLGSAAILAVAGQLGLPALIECRGTLLDIFRITSEIVDGRALTRPGADQEDRDQAGLVQAA
jgi:hypothetical protein